MSGITDLKPVRSVKGQPLYRVVQNQLRDAIDNGMFEPGQRLPSTKALSDQLSVSLVTVHRALQELVAGGVLRRGQGKGTFVHEHYDRPEHIATELRFGLVFQNESTLADPYHGRVLQGVRDAASEMGIDLVLLRYGEDWRKECAGYLYVNPFPEQLATSPRFGSSAGMTKGNVPVVGIGVAPASLEGMGVVDTDNAEMVSSAVQLLYDHGHRRIAYVGDGSPASNNLDRERGYRQMCSQLGIQIDESMVFMTRGWQLAAGGHDRLLDLLRRKDRPTAIVAGGYYLALDVYAAAKRAGLQIPTDLSVTGIDDPPSAAYLSPPMTTFRQPLEEAGRRAVEILFHKIHTPSATGRYLVLHATFMNRESVATVPIQC
jgi:DNA-binding LacI/PurR family transcriptional regulator/DNA-binding transcriptional regulator YhcF (GntR family)